MAPRTGGPAYAMLGLLALRSWSTYELAHQVHRSLRWFWPRAERTVYAEPKRLAARGLVTGSERWVGRRRTRDWEITDDGRAALTAWLGEAPEPRAVEFEGMVKVFFADGGTREQLLVTLDRIAAEARERLEQIAELAGNPSAFPERHHINAICLDYQVAQEEAVLRWARRARAVVEQWSSSTDPASYDGAAGREEAAAAARALLAEDASA